MLYMRSVLILLVCMVGVAGIAQAQTEEPDACEPLTAQDSQVAVDFADALFDDEWTRTITEEDDAVVISWILNDPLGVGFINYLVFACGYDESTIMDTYFNESYFDSTLRGYDAYDIAVQCHTGDVTLYEIDTAFEGNAFVMRRWVVLLTDTRIMAFDLVFPLDRPDLMQDYASTQFPQIPFCRALARTLP
ncbi:MAG: hypothetical protein AAF653_07880 [Chloroflexota bacterium]